MVGSAILQATEDNSKKINTTMSLDKRAKRRVDILDLTFLNNQKILPDVD